MGMQPQQGSPGLCNRLPASRDQRVLVCAEKTTQPAPSEPRRLSSLETLRIRERIAANARQAAVSSSRRHGWQAQSFLDQSAVPSRKQNGSAGFDCVRQFVRQEGGSRQR